MNVITLIDRLSKFEAEMRSRDGNKVPKRVARPSLPPSLRLTQAELVAAFGAKRPSDLSDNVRNAILVVARVHRGVDNHGVATMKAGVLIKRLSHLHGIVPVARKASAEVDHASRAAEEEADRVSDMRRLERLADEAEKRDLRVSCEKIQPECWALACRLDRTESCPRLPKGFMSMGTEDMRRLRDSLVKTHASYTNDLADRKRVADQRCAA